MRTIDRPLVLLIFAMACTRAEAPAPQATQPPPALAIAGDAERGRTLIPQYACNACHVVPGTEGPQGALGPSLAGVASRPAISNGTVRNTPENLQQFIRNPRSLNPHSAMPAVGLPDVDANDLTLFLLTLK